MWQAQLLRHTLVHKTKKNFFQDVQIILSSHFDIPSGFQLEKIRQEFPFQGPVFFAWEYPEQLFQQTANFFFFHSSSMGEKFSAKWKAFFAICRYDLKRPFFQQLLHKSPMRGYYPYEIERKKGSYFLILGSIVVIN